MMQAEIPDTILEALRYLADQCDGAKELDGAGFSAIDTAFGHRLASLDRLSAAQVAVGAKIARKYRKQLANGGIELPAMEDVEHYVSTLPAKQSHLQEIPQQPTQQCGKVYVQRKRVYVEFTYDPQKVAALQTLKTLIKKWEFNKLGKKEWSYPVENINLVLDTIKQFDDFVYDPSIALVAEQIKYDDEVARQEAEELRLAEQEEKKAALAAVAPYLSGEPLPSGRKLYGYQQEAVRQLIENGRVILAHDMGLGKSMTALVAAKAYGCAVIVICPATLKINWLREAALVDVAIEVWSWAKMPVPPESNYVLIADEAHYSQSGTKSKRGRAFLDLAHGARAVFNLTGTPIKNGRPINLFPLLQACNHPLANDKKKYEEHYCAARIRYIGNKEIYDVTGAAHLDELYKKTSGTTILRKKKTECLKDLPPKIRIFREAEVSPTARKEYQATINRLREESEARMQATKDAQDEMIKQALASGTEIDEDDLKNPDNARAIVELGILMHAGSLAKVENAIEIAQEVLEQDESIVIFTAFLDSAHKLADALHCECLTGGLSTQQRQDMIDRFQARTTRALVCTLGAGGVGITLTAAQTVLLVDRPWTPGDALQAEDRCHRIGQTGTVTAIWLQYEEVDDQIDALLMQKQERIELVLSGQRKTLRGIKSIKSLAKNILAAIKNHKPLSAELAEDELIDSAHSEQEQKTIESTIQPPEIDEPVIIADTTDEPEILAPQTQIEPLQAEEEKPADKKRGRPKGAKNAHVKTEEEKAIYMQLSMTKEEQQILMLMAERMMIDQGLSMPNQSRSILSELAAHSPCYQLAQSDFKAGMRPFQKKPNEKRLPKKQQA